MGVKVIACIGGGICIAAAAIALLAKEIGRYVDDVCPYGKHGEEEKKEL